MNIKFLIQNLMMVLLFTIVSCTDKKQDETFNKTKLVKLCQIDCKRKDLNFESPLKFGIDSKKNIHILYYKSSSVIKFGNTGKFVCKYLNKGNGPGELNYSNDLYIILDTCFVCSRYEKKIVKFDLNGNYLNIKKNDNVSLTTKYNTSNSYQTSRKISSLKDRTMFNVSLYSKSNSSKDNIELYSYIPKYKQGTPLYAYFNAFTIANSTSYIAEWNNNEYKINIYNNLGVHTSTIKRRYRKLKFQEWEYNFLKDIYGSTISPFSFKQPITGLWYDNDNNILWSATSFERNEKDDFLKIDFFKNNVYKGSTAFKEIKYSDFYNNSYIIKIHDSKLYYLNRETGILTIYKIEY